MNPRRVLAVAAVALVAAAPSSPASAGDAAATVNGVEISVAEFEEVLKEQGAGQLVPGDAGRGVLQSLVVEEALRQFEEENPVPDSLREEYEQTGMADGRLCLRLFGVADEDAGEQAMEAIADGEEFEAVASEHDPQFAQSRGTISGNPNQPCVDADGLTDAAAPIVDALEEGDAGEALGPIETEIGIFVVMAPPWDEVATAFVDLEGFTEFLQDSEISVLPRYGRWDPVALAVVPLGQE